MKIDRLVSTKLLIWLASTLVVVLSAAMTFPVSAIPLEKEILDWAQQHSNNFKPRVDLPDIQEKLSKEDYLGAETLATAEINKKGDSENPQHEAWLRAEAFRLRAFARAKLYNGSFVLQDLAESAKLGNLLAIQQLVSATRGTSSLDETATMVTKTIFGYDLNEIIAVGVDIGDQVSMRLRSKTRTCGITPPSRSCS